MQIKIWKKMKTKRVLIYLSLILLVGTFASCEKFLDIEPQQAVSDATVYSTHEGIVNALNGAYERIAGPQLYAGTSIFHSDLVGNSGEFNWVGTFIQYRQWNWKSMDPNDGFITAKWSRSYQAIDLCNNILANIETVNEASRVRVEGEARFIRGILYFELVRFYALPFVKGQANDHPGVPLVLTPTTGITDDSYPARETVANVYQAILSDLNQAKTLLADIPAGFGANGGRATKNTASAFMARVHMAMEEWALAAEEANTVINAFGGYGALHSHPRAAFNNDEYTMEDVFMINQNATSNAGQANDGITTFFASLPGLGRGDVYASGDFFNKFEPEDLRIQITDNPDIGSIADVSTMIYIGVGTDPGSPMISKWGKHDANVPVIRLAEMILTRAEANFRNGSAIGAAPLDDINAIRARSNASAWTNLTLERIAEERFRELNAEGHKLHDLRRFRGSVVAPSGSPFVGETIQWNDGRLVLPIPQREIDVNENLVQNDAYN
jgi:starch-binding outer membrane protein, SusD/RagB family